MDIGTTCARLANILGTLCIPPKIDFAEMGGMPLPDGSKIRDQGVCRRIGKILLANGNAVI